MTTKLVKLFNARFGKEPDAVEYVGAHASNRQIYRLRAAELSVIGVISSDIMENQAFVAFARHFRSYGLNVPEIYIDDPAEYAYLEEDFGTTMLLDLVAEARGRGEGFPRELEDLYTKAVEALPLFQVVAGRDLDYGLCYPRVKYDRESMIWDMHYFRDQFLLRSGFEVDAAGLERDFEVFADFLLEAESDFFMYRDYQARNIMVQNGELCFIDFQGGRKGPLQYDLASLLYQSTAYIPQAARERLTERYLDALSKVHPVDREAFMLHFRGYVLVRLLQVLGAYGRKGLGEGKRYFTEAIPHALTAMRSFLQNLGMPLELPTLQSTLYCITENTIVPRSQALTVNVASFSYKKGIPTSEEGHGGGFVFDCRCLPNPGREERFLRRTGLQDDVIAVLSTSDDVKRYLEVCTALVDQAVTNFLSRGFRSLTVCFGCTGGQHRSVFLAEEMAKHLRGKFGVTVTVRHRDMPDFQESP